MSREILVVAILIFYLVSLVFSFGNLTATTKNICFSVRSLLPPLSMLMLIGAGVVYVGGQFTGAETRSRANVWATNLLIGALIGLLIAAVAPYALVTLMSAADPNFSGDDVTSACTSTS
ncbi:MAG: hypothetical protein QXO21_02635 [Candidatus Anstonellales archaeon]